MQFFNLFNPFGLLFAVLLALPYALWRRKSSVSKTDFPNQAVYRLAQMGRLGSLFLMSVHIGVLEKGFTEPKELMQRFWLIFTAVLLLIYWLLWGLFSKNEKRWTANLLVAVSGAAVIFSGILQVNTLLLTFGVVYLVGELYLVKCIT